MGGLAQWQVWLVETKTLISKKSRQKLWRRSWNILWSPKWFYQADHSGKSSRFLPSRKECIVKVVVVFPPFTRRGRGKGQWVPPTHHLGAQSEGFCFVKQRFNPYSGDLVSKVFHSAPWGTHDMDLTCTVCHLMG